MTGAEPSPEADTDLYELEVDFDGETRPAAGLPDDGDPGDLLGRQVLAVVNLGTVSIAGFESRCLVTGVDNGEGGVVHLQPGCRPAPGSTARHTRPGNGRRGDADCSDGATTRWSVVGRDRRVAVAHLVAE